jgi:hypothetical protein
VFLGCFGVFLSVFLEYLGRIANDFVQKVHSPVSG